jgi:uncharacterized glyoxalase superfamily protein PhnB
MPSLRYRDIEAAIEWLGDAFGFEEHDIVAEVDGSIAHAQLTLGSDMVLLLPALPQGTDEHGQPNEIGSAQTQSLYFVVDDLEAHYRRATAAGADILENGEFAFGGRGYSCRDPEGHIWHFGTFDPRQRDTQGRRDGAWIREFLHGERARGLAERLRDRLNPPVLAVAGAAVVAAIAIVGWMLFALPQTSASAKERGLAFKTPLAPQSEEPPRVGAPARADSPVRRIVPAMELLSAAKRAEEAAKPADQQPDEAARRHASAPAPAEALQRSDEGRERSTQQRVEEALDKVRVAPQAADRAVEPALSTLQGAPEATPPPAKTVEQAAASPPDTRKHQLARERTEEGAVASKAAERVIKEAPNWLVETKRSKPDPAKPARIPTQPSPEADAGAQSGWNCAPSPPAGEIVCQPPVKKRVPAKASAGPRQKLFTTETAAEPRAEQQQAAAQERPREQTVGAQLWDCQPSPPNGLVVCRPMDGRGPTNR